jgi:hypothetical protein
MISNQWIPANASRISMFLIDSVLMIAGVPHSDITVVKLRFNRLDNQTKLSRKENGDTTAIIDLGDNH